MIQQLAGGPITWPDHYVWVCGDAFRLDKDGTAFMVSFKRWRKRGPVCSIVVITSAHQQDSNRNRITSHTASTRYVSGVLCGCLRRLNGCLRAAADVAITTNSLSPGNEFGEKYSVIFQLKKPVRIYFKFIYLSLFSSPSPRLNDEELSPLDVAVMTNHIPMAKMLLSHGAKENSKCK